MLSKRRLAVTFGLSVVVVAQLLCAAVGQETTPQETTPQEETTSTQIVVIDNTFADGPSSVPQDSYSASDYEVSVTSIMLTDAATGIEDIDAIHNGRPFNVVANLDWTEQIYDVDSTNSLLWWTYVSDVLVDKGSVDLTESRALPSSIEAGTTITVDSSGSHNVKVEIMLDALVADDNRDYVSFAAGASFVPLVMVIVFAATTKMVELSLGMGIFTGSCMVVGTLTGGFRTMLDVYLLDALADKDHGYVFLFILFMAGLVGLIEKSGGLSGITVALRKYVNSSRSAQAASFFAGIIIFFDDYANTLVAGASMRPLTDACIVSREKLAFIVDATAAPIASIVPISSWVGFEISLIQAELDKILANDPNPEIATTGFAVFLETIKYRYYCIFMLMFMPLMIIAGRDFGPMLIAERLTKVYGRTDGGPGAALAADGQKIKSHNAPRPDTPCRWWNMAFPIVALVGYIFYLLVWTGQQAGVGGESFIELIEISNAYQALLWGTMAAALTALLFYFIQDKKDGRIIFCNVKGYINKTKRFFDRHRGMCRRGGGEEEGTMVALEEEEVEHARVLIDYRDAMSSFLIGMEKIFGALVALTLAWATGAIMQAVGLNRFFGEILTNEALDYRILPTLTFIIAILIAFSTGTSWGTMTIMFPLVLVPSYQASDGDPVIFYGVTAGILAGAVAGDHASPISDTTILASMASECQILQHVRTQAPYALMVSVWSVLVGTLPSGRGTFANWVSILLGFFVMLFHVVATSESAINKTGRYDIFTEIYLRCTKDKEFLLKLKEDTVRAYDTGEPVPLAEADKLVDRDDTDKMGDPSLAKGASIISGEIPEQAVGEDVEKQEKVAASAVPVNEEENAEMQEQARELPDEPEIEEHVGGEEDKTQ